MTKALIRLHGCAGWSAPLLFPSNKVRVSRIEGHDDVEAQAFWLPPGNAPGNSHNTIIKVMQPAFSTSAS